jgi:ferredoxin
MLSVTFKGVEHRAPIDPEKSLLENIEAMRLPIRSACRRGLCGSCKVRLVNGDLHPDEHVLFEEYVLSCASKLTSSAHVSISY